MGLSTSSINVLTFNRELIRLEFGSEILSYYFICFYIPNRQLGLFRDEVATKIQSTFTYTWLEGFGTGPHKNNGDLFTPSFQMKHQYGKSICPDRRFARGTSRQIRAEILLVQLISIVCSCRSMLPDRVGQGFRSRNQGCHCVDDASYFSLVIYPRMITPSYRLYTGKHFVVPYHHTMAVQYEWANRM